MARTSNYALRLLASVKAKAEKVATAKGTILNQFINVAVAEKLAAPRTAQYFQEHTVRTDLVAFDRLLVERGRNRRALAMNSARRHPILCVPESHDEERNIRWRPEVAG